MTINLSLTYELTTDHPASSYGRPVLVNRTTGAVFGPGDVVNPYPSLPAFVFPPYGFMPASDAVRRLAKMKQLDEEELALVGRFIKGTKGDERQ